MKPQRFYGFELGLDWPLLLAFGILGILIWANV